MRRTIAILTLSCLLLSGVPRPGGAAVNVSRTGSENPMVEVARSIIWGGVAGLVVGSAMALASNGDNSGDIIKWSFVGGTFLGLGFGIYHVTTRPQASAALDGHGLGLGAAAPLGGSGRGGFAPTSNTAVRMTPGVDFAPSVELDAGTYEARTADDRRHVALEAIPLRDPLTGAPLPLVRTHF